MYIKILLQIHKLDLRILRLLRYGTGKKAEKHFNPLVFKKRFDVPDFTFENYKAFAADFTKVEINDLIEFTKMEIETIEAEIKRVKNYFALQTQSKFITPLRISHPGHTTWGVMDFETYTAAGTGAQIPYAWGFKIGDTQQIIIDFVAPYPAIVKTLNSIASLINKKVVLYIHNLSSFDSFFIINAALIGNYNLNVVKSERGFITISLKIGDKIIQFNDSLMLLPVSLRKLSLSFKVKNPKTYFPHLFVSPDTANYEGAKPGIEQYIDITNTEYEKLPSFFNMKREIHIYLKADLLSLHEVLELFMSRVFTDYGISITNILTLPQLAFSIWRKNYLNWREVIILPRGIEKDIRNAFYGGACEVYRPVSKKAWFYDVNSMYPCAMKKPMPVGRPVTYFWNYEPYENIVYEFFGYLKVKITIRKGINQPYAPFLPRRVDGQMMFATGTWEGWYFSEELKAGLESGMYEIKVLMGYAFKKKENLLSEYVDEFFKMKTEAQDPVTRSIAKLLLNSLYGRLGMKKIRQETIISDDTLKLDNLLNVEELEGHTNKYIYTIKTDNANVVSNVAIAAAIASYSRIKSFSIINKYKDSIMYHDTDSFVLNSPIDKEYLGEELGMMKNVAADEKYCIENDEEYYITNAFFVAPKVYCYETRKGDDVVKIKGIRKRDQKKEMVIKLYFNMGLVARTTQFMRRLKQLEITVIQQEKRLRLHGNKRKKIFRQGKWIETKPLNK